MYSAEHLLHTLSYKDLYYTLKYIAEEDCFLADYLISELTGEFVYLLEMYNLIWIASDDRLLLTQKGEKILQHVSNIVDLDKNESKVKKNKKL